MFKRLGFAAFAFVGLQGLVGCCHPCFVGGRCGLGGNYYTPYASPGFGYPQCSNCGPSYQAGYAPAPAPAYAPAPQSGPAVPPANPADNKTAITPIPSFSSSVPVNGSRIR